MDYSVFIPIIGCLLSLLALWAAMRANRKKRLIQDIPTSETSGVFIGLVEVKGTAEAEAPLVSCLAECRCVHYEYRVEEHWSRTVTETYTDSDGKTKTRSRHESGWKTVDHGGHFIPFYLRDEQGAILIQPAHADIEPLGVFAETCSRLDPLYYAKGPVAAISDSDHRRRFREWAIPLHTPLYIMGRARERADIVAPEIAYDDSAPMFLISTKSEESVGRGFFWAHLLWTILAIVVCVGGFVIRDLVLHIEPGERLWVYSSAAAGFVLTLLLVWIWMVYNSLISLRRRVSQAWSLVDIQLKRRNDLIPSLMSVVSATKAHEQGLQRQLADLRGQMGATPPGEPGVDHHSLGRQLMAIAESYPELTSNESFLNLQKNLIDTEQRIALARGYWNNIATFYNTRLEVIPDRFIAKLGGLKPRSLISAESFERAPVQLTFAD